MFFFGINVSEDVGAIAFSVQDIAGAKLYFPQAFADFALNGNTVGKTFNLDDTNVKDGGSEIILFHMRGI